MSNCSWGQFSPISELSGSVPFFGRTFRDTISASKPLDEETVLPVAPIAFRKCRTTTVTVTTSPDNWRKSFKHNSMGPLLGSANRAPLTMSLSTLWRSFPPREHRYLRARRILIRLHPKPSHERRRRCHSVAQQLSSTARLGF